MWRAIVVTLTPEIFPGPLAASVTGRAQERSLWSLETVNLRTHGIGKHRAVDDTPAGGGAGMVMRADVVAAAIDEGLARLGALAPNTPRLCLSPRGMPFTQAMARDLAEGPGALLVCGRFEGIDERVIEARGLKEISIGDYVLSGGEIAAMTVLDATLRHVPGVLGAAASLDEETFSGGLLEYPQYTRPRTFEGREIPDVLTAGDHARISEWRLAQQRALTRARRPDLLTSSATDDESETE
ncbi:MAG: tRNA (guanosine(37)-N1)-methyltransferase TrmD [Pseudomonadota bacterium]